MGLVPLSVNDLTFEEIMKKIFAYILAVAAFVSCSTDIKDVVTPTTTLTAPMEISVAESRVFDADLNWSWEASDMILAYQKAGSHILNMLTLNETGNFYNAAFEYATDEPAEFHFLYPMTAISDRGLTVEQTGKWSPVLYGVAENTTISNIGTVQMNYLSSAFEIRVWKGGRTERKNITKAVITSAADFVPAWDIETYAQSLEGKELSLDLNGDTAIFNLGEGDFAFTLTLTGDEGKTLSWELPAKNFVAGKRTVLNVEWESEAVEVVEASVTSWYEDYANNNGTALEGGAIYVTAVGGTPVVTVDGVEATVVDGKISGVASGTHNVVVTINGQELVNRSIVVTSIPTVNVTARTSYSNNGNKDTTNDINGKELQLTATLSDSAIPSSLISSCQAVYGSNTANLTLGSTSKLSVAVGEYNCYAKVTLANGYVATSAAYTTYVTGIPYSFQFYQSSNDAVDAAGWTRNGAASIKMELLTLKEGGLAGSDSGWVSSPAYYIPSSLSVSVTLQSKYYVATISASSKKATLYVGATSSPTSSSGSAQSIQLSGTNDTSSGSKWTSNTVTVSMPAGKQYTSINHNGATYTLGSRIYMASYSIQY